MTNLTRNANENEKKKQMVCRSAFSRLLRMRLTETSEWITPIPSYRSIPHQDDDCLKNEHRVCSYAVGSAVKHPRSEPLCSAATKTQDELIIQRQFLS